MVLCSASRFSTDVNDLLVAAIEHRNAATITAVRDSREFLRIDHALLAFRDGLPVSPIQKTANYISGCEAQYDDNHSHANDKSATDPYRFSHALLLTVTFRDGLVARELKFAGIKIRALAWANCPSPETWLLNCCADLFCRHREGFADRGENVIFSALIERQLVVLDEARMLSLLRVLHWPILPAFGALLSQP